MAADAACFAALRACGRVAVAASEETTDETDCGGSPAGYSVAFDPLDGSSVAGAGWAVGAIFGVWPGKGLVGRKGDDAVAAAYAVFGPRVTLVLTAPPAAGGARRASEYVLAPRDEGVARRDGKEGAAPPPSRWTLRTPAITLDPLPPGALPRVFAPANLRAASSNAAYRRLVDRLVEGGSTLRYTGAMVADVHHILAKRKGVFYNPTSPTAPPKLRLLFEVAPIALIVEAAGGAAVGTGGKRVLELTIDRADARAAVCYGQTEAVALAAEAMRV